jgi:hypothetical protein
MATHYVCIVLRSFYLRDSDPQAGGFTIRLIYFRLAVSPARSNCGAIKTPGKSV